MQLISKVLYGLGAVVGAHKVAHGPPFAWKIIYVIREMGFGHDKPLGEEIGRLADDEPRVGRHLDLPETHIGSDPRALLQISH